jgi:hypothetical protein
MRKDGAPQMSDKGAPSADSNFRPPLTGAEASCPRDVS